MFEVKQMFEAKQLQVRLGYMNSRVTVNLLKVGVLYCRVTATDIRNHSAAVGARKGSKDDSACIISVLCRLTSEPGTTELSS